MILVFRDLREKLCVFSQFFTAQEHESLVRSLVRQEELALRVRELERYRRNGIARFEECTHFEQQRARHEHIRDKISVSPFLCHIECLILNYTTVLFSFLFTKKNNNVILLFMLNSCNFSLCKISKGAFQYSTEHASFFIIIFPFFKVLSTICIS
jgi:hypothetical protein